MNQSEFDHLSIYRWGADGTARGWQRVETTIDEQSRRANASIPSLGFVTVLNETSWNESTQIRRPETIEPEDPGAIYVGTENGSIRKVTADSGETVWNRSLTGDGDTAVAAGPDGSVYAATNDTTEVSRFDWVDGSLSDQVEFQQNVHALTTEHSGSVIAAAIGDRGSNVTRVDAEAGYRPWTLIHFSRHASDYNLDAITEGTDGGIYAGLYFESRREPTRLVRVNRTALEEATGEIDNDSRLTRWETTLDARYIEDLKQRGDGLFVATSAGIRSVDVSTGSTRWSTTIDDGAAGIAVGSDGTGYAIRQTGVDTSPKLLQFDSETGSIQNTTTLPLHAQATITDLTVGTDGTIYVGSETGEVYDPDGTENSSAGDSGNETVASHSDGQLRTGTHERTDPDINFYPSARESTLGTASVSQQSNTTISIQTTQQQFASGEDVELQFSADAQTSATLRLATTDGQVLLENAVTAYTQPVVYSISGVPNGTYVATIEADGGTPTDTTETITVGSSGSVGQTNLSIQANDRTVTTNENLVLEFSAGTQTNAALRLKTTDGTVVAEQSVTATTQPSQLSISPPSTGTYVAVINASSSDASDSTGQITVSSPDDGNSTGLSLQAVERTITTDDTLVLRYSAAQETNALLTLRTAGGTTLLEQSVTASDVPTDHSITNVGAGEYVATLTAQDSNRTVSTEQITVESVSDPTLNVSAPPNEFTRSEPLAIQLKTNAQRNVTVDVRTTDGESVHNTTLEHPGGQFTFRLNGVPAGTYVVSAHAEDTANLTASTDPVTIRVVNPQVSVSPSVAETGETITFSAATNESGWSESIAETQWSFGDGTTETVSGPQASHAYSEPGDYEVSVTIVDSFGGGEEYTVTKHVSVGDTSDFIDSKGTVTALSPNGTVRWQHETNDGVAGLAESTGVAPETNPDGETTPIWSIDVPADNRTQISAAVRVTGDTNESGTLVAYNDTQTREVTFDSSNWTTVRLSVTDFAGEQITVSGRSPADGEVDVAAVRLLRHDDGDRLPNYIEGVSFALPMAKGQEFTLDPADNDTDGDGIPDHGEVFFLPANGSALGESMQVVGAVGDPTVANTDGDGLSDDEERYYPWSNPFLADTDSDGVLDPDEDRDDDGLTLAAEIENGTSPVLPDTDRDGLSDRAEIVTHGTDPTVIDTDEDGLPDEEELDLPTDPTVPDTDDDGILDGNETFTTTTSNESLGVEIALTGQGNVADGVTVEKQTARIAQGDRIGNLSVSEILEIESEQEFESANVTFSYDSLGPAKNESDLMVVTYDPEKQLYVPLNSSIDAENDTVTAETEHFSTFALFSVSNWVNDVTAHDVPERRDSTDVPPVDVQFIIDSSGSMSSNDPNEYRKQAATEFVGALVEGDRAGVVDFDGSAHVDQQLTVDFDAVNTSIQNLDASGQTDIGTAIQTANQHFQSQGNASRPKIAILLTDGVGSGGRSQARTAADHNITIHTIGFGGANGAKLKDIADITNGTYHHVDDASDLPDVFSRVAQDIPQRDSDGDGLPDVVEEKGFSIGHLGFGNETIETEPHNPDTDGDGLEDGEEVHFSQVGTTISGSNSELTWKIELSYLKIDSDPTKVDTDGDGLTDATETEGWEIQYTDSREQTFDLYNALDDVEEASDLENLDGHFRTETVTSNPQVKDTNDNDLSDLEERKLGVDPRAEDTTGDGIEDHRAVDSGADPTIYDVRPPDIKIKDTWWRKPALSWETHYEVDYRAEDPAGLERGRMFLDGEQRKSRPLEEESAFVESNITTGAINTFFDTYSGTEVSVEVSDINGNTARTVAIERLDIFGLAAKKLTQAGIVDREQIKGLGTLSGFSTGAIETAEMVESMVTDPVGYLKAVGTVIAHLDDLEEIIAQIPKSIKAQQELNNPHDEGTDAHAAFQRGWYEGYITYMVLESAVPVSKVGQAAKNSKRLQKAVDALDRTGHLRAAAKYTAQAADTAKAPVRFAGTQLTRGLAASKSFGKDVGRGLLDGAKTVGQKVRWGDHADEFSPEAAQKIANGGVPFKRAVYEAADSDALDSYAQLDRAIRKLDDLDGTAEVRVERLIRDADGAGAKLIDELDDTRLQTVLDVDIDRARALRAAFADNYAQGYATLDEVDEFAQHVKNLEGIDGLNSGPVEDFINAGDSGNVRGALAEVRRADEIGAENIQRMNIELTDGNSDVGELDIQLESGEIVESKGSFGFDPRQVNRQFRTKLETMRDHPDVEFNGNTLEVRANQIGDEAVVETKIAEWENKIATSSDWNNADITIEVFDESTGTVITG